MVNPVTRWLRAQCAGYAPGGDRPLRQYLGSLGTYTALVGAVVAAGAATGRRPPRQIPPFDVLLLTAATHKLARIVAKDPVTSPLRAPFTTFEGTSGPAELSERARGIGARHVIGELITCPFCVSQWVATVLAGGYLLAPRPTRMVAAMLTSVAGAHFLNHVYGNLSSRQSQPSTSGDHAW